MLEDVAKGLLYLHRHNPQIIHRDLTAKNVLLSTSFVAKVTDFGNSRMVYLQPDQLARTMSRLPGTLTYMPPEALETSSHYGPSLDIFSFGHLALFVGLQVFPGNLLRPTYTDPDNRHQLLARSEVERRGRYFEQFEDLLPGRIRQVLVPLTKNCLHNDPSQRPTAEGLVTSLEEMKREVEGSCGKLAVIDAVREVMTVKALKAKGEERVDEIQQLQEQLQSAETHLCQNRTQLDEQIRTIQNLNTQVREKDERLREEDERRRRREEEFTVEVQRMQTQLDQKERHLQEVNEEINRKDADISRLRRENQILSESLESATPQSDAVSSERQSGVKTPLRELKLPLNLKWRRGKDMPFGMSSYPQAVVFKGKAYIGGGHASSQRERQTVVVYDPQQNSFEALPPYTCKYFSMAVVSNQLVLVGGLDVQTGKATNKLGVWDEESRKWTHPLSPMTTACHSSSVTSHHNRWLAVMGGGGDGTALVRVDILDTTKSGQWYHAAPLPQPCYCVTTVTVGSMCYLLGGFISGGVASKKVFSVNLDELISQAFSQPAGASAIPTPSPWTTLTDTPQIKSTALSLNGSLLSVGGLGGSSAIYHYQPSSKKWTKAGELPSKQCRCACTVLPGGELFVTGSDKRVDIALVP